MILQMTIFLSFFLLYQQEKFGNRLSLQKIKFTFPLTFVLIVLAGRPLFDSQQLAFLIVGWVVKNTHYSLPHPLALFLLPSLGGSPQKSERLEEAIRHTSIAFKTKIFVLQIPLTRTMFLLSSDRWKYFHFAARRSFTHSPLHYKNGTMVRGSP